MEEAETLSDTIGIMTKGRMRCSGRSEKLRLEHTNGKKVQVVLSDQYSQNIAIK